MVVGMMTHPIRLALLGLNLGLTFLVFALTLVTVPSPPAASPVPAHVEPTGQSPEDAAPAMSAVAHREGKLVRVSVDDDLAGLAADLQRRLAENHREIDDLRAKLRERDALVKQVVVRCGSLLPNPIPDMSGVVLAVDSRGRQMTVMLSAKAGEPKPGYSFAVHADGRYKGEFVVDTVQGDLLFGCYRGRVEPAVGDKADTNPVR